MRLFHTLGEKLPVIAILLSTLVGSVAIVAWGQSYEWKLAHLSTYQVFPLLGLLAFSLLWSQYVVIALRLLATSSQNLHHYFTVTGYLVLATIILHPSLLIIQRFRDGYGLPPGSYISYVAPSLKWVVLLGSVSLVILLTYELRRWFEKKTWWRYVGYLTDIAVVAIFYHGLRLGDQLMGGWFHGVWLMYGIILLVALAIKYWFTLHAQADLPTEK